MKKTIKIVSVSLVALFLLTACGDPPTTKVNEAKQLIDHLIAAGGQEFAPEKTQTILNRYEEALAELKIQEDSLFKNYTLAEYTLNQLMDDCDLLLNKIAESKGEPVAAIVPRIKPISE